MTGLGFDRWRIERSEFAGCGIESELQDLVSAEIGRIGEAIRLVHQHRMGVTTGG